VKKFIVSLLLLLTAKPFSLYSDLPLAIGLDYSNFNKQNQLMGTISIHSPQNTLSNGGVFDIALGLRTFNFKKPAFIYNFALCKVDIFEPFVRGGVYCDFGANGDAAFGPHEQTLGNYLFGITLLNFDKTQFTNSMIQWAQIRYGLGISTYGLTIHDSGYFNFKGFIATKLGYSTINLGNINFEKFKDNNKDFKSLESGIKINMDVGYKRILYLITQLSDLKNLG